MGTEKNCTLRVSNGTDFDTYYPRTKKSNILDLVVDSTPTNSSANLVTSGGVKSSLDLKANTTDLNSDLIVAAKTQTRWKCYEPSDLEWNNSNFAYGANMFVRARGGKVFYSSDGYSWTEVPGVSSSLVAFANGRFCAPGWISYDGINWSSVSMNFPYAFSGSVTPNALEGAGNLFIYVLHTPEMLSSYSSLYSFDGVNWNNINNSTFPYARSLGYANGKYFLRGGTSDYFYYSTDGVNWTQSTSHNGASETTYFTKKFYYANGIYLYPEGTDMWTSTNGITWVKTSSTRYSITNVFVANNKFYSNYLDYLLISSDGLNWSTVKIKDDGGAVSQLLLNSANTFIVYGYRTLPSSTAIYCYWVARPVYDLVLTKRDGTWVSTIEGAK